MAILATPNNLTPKSLAAQSARRSVASTPSPFRQILDEIDHARQLAVPQARWVGQPRHVGRSVTFCLDAVSRGSSLEDLQRMGRYAKDRLNAAYIRLTQRADGYTVLEVPTTVSRDIYLDGNRAVLSDAQVMLGPLFSEPGSAILNFDDPISRNVLVTGSLTEGTMLLRALWYQLIRQNRPSDLRFVVIDTGGTLPTSVHNSAHLLFTPILNTHNPGESTNSDLRQFEMRQALQAVAHEIHRRQTGASARPRWVVMITEIADLLQRKGLLRLLDHILQQGRQARIHVVACTARVEPVVLQHDLVQRYFQARLVGQMPDSARSELACGGPDYHAEWSLGNGDFTYTHTNQRFQCGIVSDSELKYLPRAVALPDVWSIATA